MNKFTHPFFLGLAVILLSFFLNFMTAKPTNNLIDVSISSSMKDYAFGGKPTIKSDAGLGGFFMRSYDSVQIGVPRALGVYYTIMFFLAIWGIIMYFFNPDLRNSNKRAIAIGIAGLFILNVLVIIYEINYYEDALGLTVGNFYKLSFGIGFYGFLAGVIASMVGAFKHFDIVGGSSFSGGIKLKPISS